MQTKTNEHTLPIGWRWVNLGDVCLPKIANRDPKREPDKTFLYVDITSIDSSTKTIVDPKSLFGKDAPSRARQVIQTGDVIVSTTRPNLNAVAKIPAEFDEQICSTGFCVLRPNKNELDTDFLFHFVRTQAFVKNLSDLVKGALYPAVSDKDVRAQIMPLPPLDEQRQITSRLNEQLAAVESARKAAEEQLHAAYQLPSAYLRDVFDVQTLPNGWLSGNLGDFAFVTKLAGFEYTEYVNYQEVGEIPVIRAQNVTPNGFKESNFVYVSRELANQLTRSQLFGGDILMVFIGAGLGNVGILPDGKEYFLGPNVALIRPDKKVLDNKYLYYFLQSDIGRSSIFGFIQTTAQGSISMGNIRNVQVAFPSLDEQRRIANRLNEQLAGVNSVSTAIESQLAEIESLPASLLREAFAGGD